MHHRSPIFLLSFLLVLLAATGAHAAAVDERAELEAKAPEAVPLWDQANEASLAGRHDDAFRLYRQLLAKLPDFDPAHRRMCDLLTRVGQRDEGLAECKAALGHAETPENKAALASALLSGEYSSADLDRAGTLAEQAVNQIPHDKNAVVALCQVAMARDDRSAFEKCSQRLLRIDPEGKEANVYAAMLAIMNDQPRPARAALARARAAGLEEDAIDDLTAQIETLERRGQGHRDHADADASADAGWGWDVWSISAVASLVWLGVLAVLFVLGTILSAIVLRTATRGPGALRAHATAGELSLRRAYGVVVGLCGLFFYVTVPLILFVVVGLGGTAIWRIIETGHVPVKLIAMLALVIVATVSIVVRSLFARGDDSDPGIGLDPRLQPRLQRVLHEVAAEIGTRPVDAVFLTPGTDLAVFERGGGLFGPLRGATQRCLILGVGVLEGMTLDGFRSILAHEYGHFHNQDTARGGFALAVQRSMRLMLIRMMLSGNSRWINPAWWFLIGFAKVFVRVSQGETRLQEVLADRWAAIAYGSEAFERGFTHVIRRSVCFDAHIQATIDEVVRVKRPLANLYAYRPVALDGQAHGPAIERTVEEVMNARPGAYDSHPQPHQRLAWVHALAAPRRPRADDGEPVWSLFEDREAIERRMTAEVRDALAVNHNLVIHAGAPRSP